MLRLTKKNNDQILKPIFLSEFYLEASCAYCDLCFTLFDFDKELCFECTKCENFVACLDCIKDKTHRLVGHPSDHIFSPNKPRTNTHWIRRNLNVTCDLCKEESFFDKRYQCRQCYDYNVCSKCLSKAEENHCPTEQHTFIYIPNLTKIHTNRCLLADRVLRIFRYRGDNATDRDETTGWTFSEAETIYIDERNNYFFAREEASQILQDNDPDFSPSIIEHEKIELPLVVIGD